MTSKDDRAPRRGHEHDEPTSLAHQLVDAAHDVAADVADEATELGGRIADAAGPIAERVATAGATAGAAAGRLFAATASRRPGREGARIRELRRRNRSPLPNLYDLHPEARTAPRRNLGLLTIPVSRIQGSAVEGPAQRGGDFLPLPALKSSNWRSRWQRLRSAQDRLAILPPIDVLQTPEGYWVTDGHNRVGLALFSHQDDIDASVTHLHLPGTTDDDVQPGQLTTVLDDARQVRAAGEGRLSRGGSARTRSTRTSRDEAPDG